MPSLWKLFVVFARIGGVTFGGGMTMLPILQSDIGDYFGPGRYSGGERCLCGNPGMRLYPDFQGGVQTGPKRHCRLAGHWNLPAGPGYQSFDRFLSCGIGHFRRNHRTLGKIGVGEMKGAAKK